jgi:hypothetical protein
MLSLFGPPAHAARTSVRIFPGGGSPSVANAWHKAVDAPYPSACARAQLRFAREHFANFGGLEMDKGELNRRNIARVQPACVT